MPVRDLGYRPYQGERLPPSHNTMVLLRHGMKRAWGSWLVKIAVFLGWAPAAIFAAVTFVQFRMAQQGPAQAAEELATSAAPSVAGLLSWQMWLFVTLTTLGGGAGAIAEDLTHRAFQFYFAKPVTAEQYLGGRIAAIAVFCFGSMTFAAVIGVLAVTAFAPDDELLSRAGLLLPAVFHSAVVAVTLATVSVGLSSLSRSRALTMSAWVMVFLIPEILAVIVRMTADWPWLGLASLPTLLSTIAMGLFKIDPPTELHWYHAAVALVVWLAGSVALALRRLRHAEVIT